MIEAREVLHALREKNWAIRNDSPHWWLVGPETSDGMMNILGMGTTLLEAFNMAVRSDTHE